MSRPCLMNSCIIYMYIQLNNKFIYLVCGINIYKCQSFKIVITLKIAVNVTLHKLNKAERIYRFHPLVNILQKCGGYSNIWPRGSNESRPQL